MDKIKQSVAVLRDYLNALPKNCCVMCDEKRKALSLAVRVLEGLENIKSILRCEDDFERYQEGGCSKGYLCGVLATAIIRHLTGEEE